ncbi:flagellar hook-length control protein FliK [Sulfitobacter sp. JL08]|uniref:flagellar hook-length control protein FliK n=1 Tax=Sulfitobacter sp. JL08 TaxID=2070369 RepID=UPI0013B464EA|nr:flagellar hook-length control protein FliK [Sulfitobacter sp. JL08]
MHIDPSRQAAMNSGLPIDKGDTPNTGQHLDAVFGRLFAALELAEQGDKTDPALPAFDLSDDPVEPLENADAGTQMSSRSHEPKLMQNEMPTGSFIPAGPQNAGSQTRSGVAHSITGVSSGTTGFHGKSDAGSVGLQPPQSQTDQPLAEIHSAHSAQAGTENRHAGKRIAPETPASQTDDTKPFGQAGFKVKLDMETIVRSLQEEPRNRSPMAQFEDAKTAPILRTAEGAPMLPVINQSKDGLQIDPPDPQIVKHQEMIPSNGPPVQKVATRLQASGKPESAQFPVESSQTETHRLSPDIRDIQGPELSTPPDEKAGHPAQPTETGKFEQARPALPIIFAQTAPVPADLMTEAAAFGGIATEELGLIANTAPTGSSDMRLAMPPVARADLPQTVTRQLIEVIRSGPDTPVEVSLNPEELGRVRVALSAQDTGVVSVTIAAERPETLALLKRHIDQLVQDFQALGYSGAEFSFAQDNRSWGASDGSQENSSFAGQAEITSNAPPDSPLLIQTSGLDLRL